MPNPMSSQEVIEVLRKLDIDCTDPTHSPVEYVSRDMALDAEDKSLEGSVYREETWERCGACPNCMFNQIKSELIASLQEYEELKARVDEFKIAQILAKKEYCGENCAYASHELVAYLIHLLVISVIIGFIFLLLSSG